MGHLINLIYFGYTDLFIYLFILPLRLFYNNTFLEKIMIKFLFFFP